MPSSEDITIDRQECSNDDNPFRENNELLDALHQLVTVAVDKLKASQCIVQIQALLKDPGKEEHEKFIGICQLVDKYVKENAVKGQPSDNFYKLFKKEISDFFSQEIKNTLKKEESSLLARLENMRRWLNGEWIKPSPVRDLLNELKALVDRRAKENYCWSPIPTGVKQLSDLLKDLEWIEDEKLPHLLREANLIIQERLKTFLYRDTYLLYRNFHFILSEISELSFAGSCRVISNIKEFGLKKRKKTQDTFLSLYLSLVELKAHVNLVEFNKKGRILGIFSNKLPDGIHRLRMVLNTLPSHHLLVEDKSQIQLIKIFMQIREILAEKAIPSAMRAQEIEEFYIILRDKINAIYEVISKEDSDVFCTVHKYQQKSDQETLSYLAILKECGVLADPEKILDKLEEIGKLFESTPYEASSSSQPSCSHWS
ncbi:MAG: hypothetical protein V4700_06155 [Pseudomonadota bacterium]